MAHQPTPGDTKECARIGNFWTIVPRGDGGENGHSSGTSGPVASRDDGAIFLTATKTNKGSVRLGGFLLTLLGFLFSQRRRFFHHALTPQKKLGSNARCLYDFQGCSERCCTTRSRRQNNYQIQSIRAALCDACAWNGSRMTERCFIGVADRIGNNASVSVRACNIRYSCARRVPDVRPCAARVGAAWYRVQKRGTTWHRVGRAANWSMTSRFVQHDPVTYGNQCAVLRLT